MSVLKFSIISIILLVFASQFFVPIAVAEIGEGQAASALADADGVMLSAYQAVLEAEESGAKVSSLLVRLNEAGENLARAHVAYGLGDFYNTTRFADLSRIVGEDVRSEADQLKSLAMAEGVQRLWSTMTGSVIGLIAVVFGSFFVWQIFKRRYSQQVLDMKPEVGADES